MMVMADAFLSVVKPRWTLLIRVDCVRASFEPHLGKGTGRQAVRYKANPEEQQALQEPTNRHLRRYDNSRTAPTSLNQALPIAGTDP
jgi:hypothetical protein